MKKPLTIIILSLLCSPALAQDRDLAEARGQQLSEITVKFSNKVQADCSQKVWECGQKIQELASQQKDFTEQVKICQEIGQQVGSCIQQQMIEFSNDFNDLSLYDPNFDSIFNQLVKKWGIEL